jgi:DNA-directed RNA polymerase specialized sigma24 family protein
MLCWDGLTAREVAAVLDVSANVVRVRAHRARARLRSLLASETEPGLRQVGSRGAVG